MVEPGLEPLVKGRPGTQFVDHVKPRAFVTGQAVDEHDGNLAALVRLKEFQSGLRVASAERLNEPLDGVGLRQALEHVEQRHREIGGQQRPSRTDVNRRDIQGIDQIKDGWSMVAGERARELLQGVFVARHLEPQHRGRGNRLTRRRKIPGHTPLGALGEPHRHWQTEATPGLPAGNAFVVLGTCRHDRLDGGGIDGQ